MTRKAWQKNHAKRHHRSKDIKHATWHRDVTDLEKNRGGCQKQQHSNFGAQQLYDQQAYHDNAIHIMEVDMILNNMQLESLNSDKRLRRNRHPKLQQINSFSNSSTLTSGSPLWSKI